MVGINKMKFSITGWLGRRITLTWEDGKLFSDDHSLLSVINQVIEEYERDGFVVQEYPGGPSFGQDYLQHPYSAYLILLQILQHIENTLDTEALRGDLPAYHSEGLIIYENTD
jgi:hypothetical protein